MLTQRRDVPTLWTIRLYYSVLMFSKFTYTFNRILYKPCHILLSNYKLYVCVQVFVWEYTCIFLSVYACVFGYTYICVHIHVKATEETQTLFCEIYFIFWDRVSYCPETSDSAGLAGQGVPGISCLCWLYGTIPGFCKVLGRELRSFGW